MIRKIGYKSWKNWDEGKMDKVGWKWVRWWTKIERKKRVEMRNKEKEKRKEKNIYVDTNIYGIKIIK